jgi:hypothetical protein
MPFLGSFFLIAPVMRSNPGAFLEFKFVRISLATSLEITNLMNDDNNNNNVTIDLLNI